MTNTQNTTSSIVKLDSGDHFAVRHYPNGDIYMTSALDASELNLDFDNYEYDHDATEDYENHTYEVIRSSK